VMLLASESRGVDLFLGRGPGQRNECSIVDHGNWGFFVASLARMGGDCVLCGVEMWYKSLDEVVGEDVIVVDHEKKSRSESRYCIIWS